MVNFICLNCEYSTTVADQLATRRVMCPRCNTKGRVDGPIPEFVDARSAQDAKQDAMANSVLEFELIGVQDTLDVYVDKVSITPKGMVGFFNKGLKGTKEIPYRSIVAIQFKDAGELFNGYLQFTIPGGSESKRGLFEAVRDENTFVFRGTQNNALARQIKGFIQWEIDKLHAQSQRNPPAEVSISEELTRLADLRAKGVLSDEEFSALKKRLIG